MLKSATNFTCLALGTTLVCIGTLETHKKFQKERAKRNLIVWSNKDFIGPVSISKEHEVLKGERYISPCGNYEVYVGEHNLDMIEKDDIGYCHKTLFPDGNTRYFCRLDKNWDPIWEGSWDINGNGGLYQYPKAS